MQSIFVNAESTDRRGGRIGKRTGVMTRRVGVPDVDEDIGERFAGLDVDYADIH